MRLAFAVIVLSILAGICLVGLFPAFGPWRAAGILTAILLGSFFVMSYLKRRVALEFEQALRRHEIKYGDRRVCPKMTLE